MRTNQFNNVTTTTSRQGNGRQVVVRTISNLLRHSCAILAEIKRAIAAARFAARERYALVLAGGVACPAVGQVLPVVERQRSDRPMWRLGSRSDSAFMSSSRVW